MTDEQPLRGGILRRLVRLTGHRSRRFLASEILSDPSRQTARAQVEQDRRRVQSVPAPTEPLRPPTPPGWYEPPTSR